MIEYIIKPKFSYVELVSIIATSAALVDGDYINALKIFAVSLFAYFALWIFNERGKNKGW